MFWKKEKEKTIEPQAKSDAYFIKMALLGDGAVGKTSLRNQFMGKGFTADHIMTIGADFAAHDKVMNYDNREIKVTFQIWDLAGQSSFSDVRSLYYRGCSGCLLVFDRTRPLSFENLPSWIDELKKHSGKGIVPFLILGNKYDLIEGADLVVSDEEIEEFVAELNVKYEKKGVVVHYLNTSAKTGINVEDAFNKLGMNVLAWLDA